jgi:hypothetical protein
VVQSNQISNCPVTVQDIDAAHTIWGKNIAALKGKTTQKKPIHVARDFVKVPTELLKLHKEVFLTADIFFVNQIPFFLTHSRRICFTAVNHLANRKADTIFKAFLEIYRYYLNRGFCITTVHADGEFAPLQALIHAIPNGPTVNLASSSEHGCQGKMPVYPTQPSFQQDIQALDNTYRISCCQIVEPLPREGRNFGHNQSKNYHVRRDSPLQETLESANRAILPGTRRRCTSQ